jgi:hypothetical protein
MNLTRLADQVRSDAAILRVFAETHNQAETERRLGLRHGAAENALNRAKRGGGRYCCRCGQMLDMEPYHCECGACAWRSDWGLCPGRESHRVDVTCAGVMCGECRKEIAQQVEMEMAG